jgi:hypothetical protein
VLAHLGHLVLCCINSILDEMRRPRSIMKSDVQRSSREPEYSMAGVTIEIFSQLKHAKFVTLAKAGNVCSRKSRELLQFG